MGFEGRTMDGRTTKLDCREPDSQRRAIYLASRTNQRKRAGQLVSTDSEIVDKEQTKKRD